MRTHDGGVMDEQHHETQSNATSSSEVEPAAGSEADPGSGVEPGMEAGDDSGSRTGIRGLRRLRSKRLMIGIGALLLAVGLVVAGATVRVNKVIEAPGPTWNVLAAVPGDDSDQSVITVTGAQTYPAEGALRMTTVSVSGCPGYPVTLFDVVGAWLSPNKTILERDQVCPPSLSQQDVEETNQAQMTSSQNTAVVAALMETGMATRMVLTVEGTGPDQTEGLLQKGDVLTSITPAGGQATPTTTYTALRELLTTVPVGTTVELGIERDGEPMTVSLTTITPPDANSDGSPDSEGSLLGVYLSAEADSDIEATFGLSKVGGPSAGSMFALGIVDELTPGDLTGGKDIAGTGTIALDGSIGPIGGIEQKMAGAKTDGSGYFLAPASNCADVVGHVPDGLEVYAVSTLHEAVTTVEAIAAEDTSGASTCEAVLAQQ